MSNIDKQAQGEKTREAFERWAEQSGALPWGILKKHRNQDGTYPGPHYTYMWHAWNACHEALLDELEAKDKLNAELMEKQRLIDICQGQGLEHRIAAEKRAEAAEKKAVEMPTFDGYVPQVARELQAAFRIACDNAGINIAAAGKGEAS